MKKRSIAFLLVFSLVLLLLSVGCKGSNNEGSETGSSDTTVESTAEQTEQTGENTTLADETTAAGETSATTKGATAGNGKTTTSKKSDSTTSATKPSEDIGVITNIPNPSANDPYCLNMNLGSEPALGTAKNRGDQFFTSDKKWYIDQNITINNNRIIVNGLEGSVAFNTQKSLDSEWKVGASFRPLKRYSSSQDPEPICSRLFINNAAGSELFILTVNYIPQAKQVEITMQMLSTTWRTLCSTDGWVETDSTRFYMELSRAANSKKLHVKVVGDKGELMNKDTPINIKDELLDAATVAGLGVWASATEYFYWRFESNGTTNFEFPKASK